MFRKIVLFILAWLVLTPITGVAAINFWSFLVERNRPNICGETHVVTQPRVLPQNGEYAYNLVNSGLKGMKIRTLRMGQDGLWIGYADNVGVGHFDGKLWRFCKETPHVNAIVLDKEGRPWVGTDAPPPQKEMPYSNALLHYDGNTWIDESANLLDYRIYDLVLDQDNLYVANWEGVAKYDGSSWTVPYSTRQNNLLNDHVHAVAFIKHGDLWFGTIDRGITWYSASKTPALWISVQAENLVPGKNLEVYDKDANKVREITISPNNEQVWIATDGVAVSGYMTTLRTNGHVIFCLLFLPLA